MDQLFYIHQVSNIQKVIIASLHLEPQQFLLYYCLCEHKNKRIISWSIFIEELISYDDDDRGNSFFTKLINLRKKGPIIKYIQQFKKFSQSKWHTR